VNFLENLVVTKGILRAYSAFLEILMIKCCLQVTTLAPQGYVYESLDTLALKSRKNLPFLIYSKYWNDVIST
jgi:hypothetical protein